MALQINYTNTARLAVIAAAGQFYRNQGNLTGALLLGIIGNLGIALCSRVNQEIQNIKLFGPEKFPFRILSSLNPEPLKNVDQIEKALVRVEKDYPEELKEFSKKKDLVSKDQTIDFFKSKLNEGCCYGTANALFDKISRGTSASLLKSICTLQAEDMFYHQILQFLEGNPENLELQLNIVITERRLDALLQAVKERSTKPCEDFDCQLESMKIELREQYQKRIEALKRNDHSRNFSTSDKFSIEAASSVYRETLEKAMLTFPKERDIVGVVNLPKHVISFQYGPRGYFLCDFFDIHKGFFEYYNSDSFFSQLREQVLHDVRWIKQGLIEKENPSANPRKIREDAEELLKKTSPHYSIRPLRQINPFFEECELPPVTRELSEGWRGFINRKFESYIHSFALATIQVFSRT